MTKSQLLKRARRLPAGAQFSVSVWRPTDVNDVLDELQIEGRIVRRAVFGFEKKGILAEFVRRGELGLPLTHENLKQVAQEIIEEYDETRLRVHGCID